MLTSKQWFSDFPTLLKLMMKKSQFAAIKDAAIQSSFVYKFDNQK